MSTCENAPCAQRHLVGILTSWNIFHRIHKKGLSSVNSAISRQPANGTNKYMLRGATNASRFNSVQEEEKPFKCKHCDFSISCKQRHQKHVERAHDRFVWETRLKCKCELCPYKCHMPSSLRLQMLTHTEDRNYFPCKYPGCNFEAKSSVTLDGHYKRLHSDERPFSCKLDGCTFRATFAADIRQHIVKHRTDKLFLCSENNCS